MSSAREPLAKHVAPRLTQARLASQWANVEGRLSKPSGLRLSPRAMLPLSLSFAAGVVALGLFLFLKMPVGPRFALGGSSSSSATLVDGTWLESPASGPLPAVSLRDGSRVELGAASRLRFTEAGPASVRLDLERGRVSVQATHSPGRPFVVVANDVRVNVVGTRFVVDADGSVRVRVDEGRVRVDAPDGEHFVSAGEEWVEPRKPEVSPAPSDVANVPPALDIDDVDAGAAHSLRRDEGRGPDAKSLLDSAQRAIADRRAGDAAKFLGTLLRDHRSDPRAALAAFELGRLRLDSLGDPGGAEVAFREAARLASDKELRDDAQARHVEALGRMGRRAECERARTDYLTAHPNGLHRAEVKGWCGGP